MRSDFRMPALTLGDVQSIVKDGKDVENIAKEMTWQDFEGIAAEIFAANGFRTHRNFRFSSKKKRYEIDVVAMDSPRIILADCKHWSIRQGKTSGLRAAAEAQKVRAIEFASKIQEYGLLGIQEWKPATVIPMVITLYQESIVEGNGTFVVPLFKLNSFIEGARNGLCCGKEVKPRHIDSWI